jgi:hypothetical protein
MALEVEDFNESAEEKKVVQVQEVKAPTQNQGILDVVKQLQNEIELLKNQRGLAPQQSPVDQAALLEKLVDKISGNKSDATGFMFEHNYVSESEIDPDDVLEKDEWVTFVTHTVGHVIVDDLRNGKPVRVPFGKISFTYDSTRQVKNGKEVDLYNLCKYTCKSKKELKWLKDHSMYGRLFFDNIKGAKSVDGAKALKLASAMRGLSSMGQQDIINTARSYGLSVGGDISSLRGEIAQLVVERQIRAEKAASEGRVNDANLEAELIGRELK